MGLFSSNAPGIPRLAPERRRLQLGYSPLTDCAPLAVAAELGYFREEGLDVRLQAEPSWANIRDKIHLGALDAAQMLAPMPIASTLGIGAPRCPTIAAAVLNLNGNAITVSNAVHERMSELDPRAMLERPTTARALAALIRERRAARRPRLRLATVFPVSAHNYQLRYWLGAAGIDPDKDVELRVVPPPLMAAHLEAGWIDGYCVGEPWNSVAVANGLGRTLITSYEIWNNGQEKVLGVTRDWADAHPNTLRALLRAILRACRWLDRRANRGEAAALLSDAGYVAAPASVIAAALIGRFRYSDRQPDSRQEDLMVFHRYAANYPWRSQALWYASQMARWGQWPDLADLETAVCRSFRPDLYRQAAGDLGLAVPVSEWKREGEHDAPWMLENAGTVIPMGEDRFFDGETFDPGRLADYLSRLPVSGARGCEDRRELAADER
jgi:nitrate/nitrite transport system substrate-binding protein